MFNYKIRAIFKKEFRHLLLNKAFVSTVLLLGLLIIIFTGMLRFLMQPQPLRTKTLVVTSDSQNLLDKLNKYFDSEPWLKKYKYRIRYIKQTEKEFTKWLEANRSALMNFRIDGVINIPSTSRSNKRYSYFSKHPPPEEFRWVINSLLNRAFTECYFKDREVLKADITFASLSVKMDNNILDDGSRRAESAGDYLLAYVSSFINVIFLIILGTAMMQTILEEKADKTCENVLSSVSTKEVLQGKIYAMTLAGFIIVSLCLLPVYFLYLRNFASSVSDLFIPYYMINLIIGTITFLSVFAAAGSLFNEIHRGHRAMGIMGIIISMPIFVLFTIINNPGGGSQVIFSLLPFTSLILMPARLTVENVPLWQLFFSLLTNICTMAIVFTLSARIYKRGILCKEEINLRKVLEWLKKTD